VSSEREVFEYRTDMSYYDQILEHPEYYKKTKGIVCRIERMSPDEYLDRCYEMQLELMRERIPKEEYMLITISKELSKKYAEAMERGEKFPLPVLDYKHLLQEGRNRAYAAKLIGIEEIPVLVCEETED